MLALFDNHQSCGYCKEAKDQTWNHGDSAQMYKKNARNIKEIVNHSMALVKTKLGT